MSGTIYPNQLHGRHIRILELLPGDPSEEVCCRLEERFLDDLPSYNALSYVWGDSRVKESISCNGQRMDVTTNLADALRTLRPSSATWVWADAICINQDDVLERNSQVQLMKEVYSKAEKVAIWLGK
ncbi:HET-domain-containing protein, partial [Setomelanomma holmii]